LRNCPKQSLKEGRKEDPGNPSKTLAIPGDFAMRVFEKGTMYNLWRNPKYHKSANKVPPEPEEEEYVRPPRDIFYQGGEALDRYCAQFPKHFARLAKEAERVYKSQHGNLTYFTPAWQPSP
jgi:hypothetical protein